MCTNPAAVLDVVKDFAAKDEMFTSVDVANEVKRRLKSMEVRNRHAAQWLRDNFGTNPAFQDYDRTFISVNGGRQQATLYFPHWADPDDYQARDQKALGPDDITNLAGDTSPNSNSTSTQQISAVAVTTPADPDPDDNRKDDSRLPITDLLDDGDTYDPDSTGVRMKRRLASVERLWIPADITKILGWHPGDTVDINKVKIHTGSLNPNLKIHHDGRFAIPRRCIGYGTDAIKVILKGEEIYFEKA